MEFIQLVNRAQVNDHIERYSILAVFRMEHVSQFSKVEQTEDFETTLLFGSYFTPDSLDGKFERVRFRLHIEGRPIGITVFVYRTDLEGIISFSFQPVEQQFCISDSRVQHIVEFNFVEVSTCHFIPGRFQ